MDFTLNESRRLMADSLERMLRDCRHSRSTSVPTDGDAEGGTWDRDVWTGLRELGVTALAFDQSAGGVDGDGVDMMLVAQRLGESLATTPFIASVVMGGMAIDRAGDPLQRAAMLPGLASGRLIAAWAHGEGDARHVVDRVETIAEAGTAGWTLSGRKTQVGFAAAADVLVVSAHEGSETGRLRLFTVDPQATGVTIRSSQRIDGTPIASVVLASAPAIPLQGVGLDAVSIVREVEDRGNAASVADALGTMEAAMRLTLSHLSTRRQFGVPIGSFQALQHRAADMYVALEQTRSMVMYAATCVDSTDARERGAAVAAARIVTDRASRLIGDSAIQLHGGIGMTEEYAVGRCARRLAALRSSLGSTDDHARRLAALGGVIEFP